MLEFAHFLVVISGLFFVYYTIILIQMLFCVHNFAEDGSKTEHIFIDLKTNKLSGYERHYKVCHKCGKRKKGTTTLFD
jgi:hypothetical protein